MKDFSFGGVAHRPDERGIDADERWGGTSARAIIAT
jgi:hypothetical protein